MEQPEKRALSERIRRVLWIWHKLAAVNFICFLIFLPVFTWFYLVLNTYAHAGLPIGVALLLPGLGYFSELLLRLPPGIFYALFAISAVLFGPFLFGLHYFVSATLMERHVWISDLFVQAKQHARRGIPAGLCLVAGTHLLLWNIFGGVIAFAPWVSLLLTVSRWVSMGLLLFLVLALPYFCQITVWTDLPLSATLKNARILTRVYLGRGLLLLLVIGIFWWGALSLIPVLGLASLPLILIGGTAFAQAAVCLPVMERHVL